MIRKVKNVQRYFILFLIMIYIVMTAGMCLEKSNLKTDSSFGCYDMSDTRSTSSKQISHLSNILMISPEDACIADTFDQVPENVSILYHRFKLSDKLHNHFLSYFIIVFTLSLFYFGLKLTSSIPEYLKYSQDIIVCYIHHQDGKKSSLLHNM